MKSPYLFEVFLQNGVQPPQGNWDSWLDLAFRKRDHDKSRLLLARGARADKCAPNGLLMVESATLAGATNFVKLLLDYGAPAGRSIYYACRSGNHDLVSVLLGCGVSPSFTHFPYRETALSAAIRGRHDRVAELLVKAGVETGLSLPEGQSAFHLAIATGCHNTVKQLLAAGANPNAPFVLPVSPAFIRQVRPGVMRWILKYDRNVTPLMLAVDSGNIHTAKYLLTAGAKINVWTRPSELWPLNFATRRGDVKMSRLFFGQNPFHEERIIEIRLSEQRARMYDSEGNEILTTKISTGRRGFATPTGEFVITDKYRDWTSTLYHASMPYFQRLSGSDFGLHQGYVPDYPASHGCIRVPEKNAAKLFAMTKPGDRVSIMP